MSTRTFSASCCIALLLTGCAPESGLPEGEAVECALDGANSFADDCIFERLSADTFAIHHPDGGFHRFRYDEASGMLTIADGAEGLAVIFNAGEGTAEFGVGSQRYRVSLDAISSSGS